MGVFLNQCMSIVNLTSSSWGPQQYSAVAHTFRVMSKSRNFDEMIVGMMHEFYAASSYTRSLYSCDVEGDPAWGKALSLFVWPIRTFRRQVTDEVSNAELLRYNMPQNLSPLEKEQWLDKETRWSQKYRRWLLKIKENPIARRVMIYDLEDKLDVLRHPGLYEDTLGPQFFVLPWKKHYDVNIRGGKRFGAVAFIPKDDDPLLLKPLTDNERNNLILKYEHARQLLSIPEDEQLQICDYTKEEIDNNCKVLKEWFNEWLIGKEWENQHYADEGMTFDDDPI